MSEKIYSESLLSGGEGGIVEVSLLEHSPLPAAHYPQLDQPLVTNLICECKELMGDSEPLMEILYAIERAYARDDLDGAIARLDLLEELLDARSVI